LYLITGTGSPEEEDIYIQGKYNIPALIYSRKNDADPAESNGYVLEPMVGCCRRTSK